MLEVLRGGPTALRIGKHVREMERLVAESFGKRRGIMCNSGSSALYLAIELLGLAPGDEIVTSPLTFSTDIAPMVRSRLVPVFVDVTPDTYQIDVERIERSLGPRTKAILAPNLTGNCPDWDAHPRDRRPPRPRGDRGLLRLPRRHAARHAHRHGAATSASPASRSRTSSPRRARAAWCASTTRRSPTAACCCGAGAGAARCSSSAAARARATASSRELDGIEYDNLFIFDELGWNFEPSELVGRVRRGADEEAAGEPRAAEAQLRAACASASPRTRAASCCRAPRPASTPPGTCSRSCSGPSRASAAAHFQQHMEAHGVDTRMVWTGNAVRQPAFRDIPMRDRRRRPRRTPTA